ncbi:SfnB family sulfur acquisition oxidoreductase [Phyllobacterium myrsinacearum]|uniref:Dibenzothiophene monooxygenase n=1 Tax=Phyllobacterium myrsinacearum TaxID=28101 RepID=A0A839EJF9_9HYPH|nr:SfnB family sulfur acquisition oxidoreductase [Phyllobacterium myrsinacearum]MBA8880131.1 SfnB family sulfur acquisition oxidoreductase [Phyllobacterium myrsinacearum]
MTSIPLQRFDTGEASSVAAHRIASDREALQTAKQLAETFAKGAAERDRDRRLPYQELEILSHSGLLAITVPREFGGIDVAAATLAEVTAILSQADPSIGQIPQNHFYILEALRVDGTPEQQAFFFERVLQGDRFGNALSEKGTKTVAHYNTRIVPDGAHYRINGQKFYSTGVLFADWVVIFATDPQDQITMSFVPRDTPGLTLVDDWAGFGQRTTGSGTTIIADVIVEAAAVVQHHKGFERPSTIGSVGQIIHAAVDLGIARAALDETVNFVRTKSRPWMDSGQDRASEDPHTIARVGDLAIRIDAATALLARSGDLVDKAKESPSEDNVVAASLAVAGAKVLTTEAALQATNLLFELAGTSSTQSDLNLDRHWRNARTHTLHDPVRWKYHVVGNYLLNDVAPPRHGAL